MPEKIRGTLGQTHLRGLARRRDRPFERPRRPRNATSSAIRPSREATRRGVVGDSTVPGGPATRRRRQFDPPRRPRTATSSSIRPSREAPHRDVVVHSTLPGGPAPRRRQQFDRPRRSRATTSSSIRPSREASSKPAAVCWSVPRAFDGHCLPLTEPPGRLIGSRTASRKGAWAVPSASDAAIETRRAWRRGMPRSEGLGAQGHCGSPRKKIFRGVLFFSQLGPQLARPTRVHRMVRRNQTKLKQHGDRNQ
jgi:hypothetical protein